MKVGNGILLRSEKYVQAHDFVEMNITNYLNHSVEIESIFETIKQLAELLDIEKTVTIIFENKMANLIHQIVPLLQSMNEEKSKEFIIECYKRAITMEMFDCAAQLLYLNELLIVRNTAIVMPYVLDSIEKSSFFMEAKLAILKQFYPYIQFYHVDVLV